MIDDRVWPTVTLWQIFMGRICGVGRSQPMQSGECRHRLSTSFDGWLLSLVILSQHHYERIVCGRQTQPSYTYVYDTDKIICIQSEKHIWGSRRYVVSPKRSLIGLPGSHDLNNTHSLRCMSPVQVVVWSFSFCCFAIFDCFVSVLMEE